jgi:hypothetical protein
MWFAKLSRRAAPARRRSARAFLAIELLEERTLPAFLAPISFPSIGGDVAAGDFNGDGIMDLAGADRSANAVTVLIGKGDGSFQSARSSPR